MNLSRIVPLVLLFAWQAGPSPEPGERPSRFRLWFGRGVSSYDIAYWGTGGGCSGPTYRQRYEETETLGAQGVQADAWPSPSLRLSAAAGGTSANAMSGAGAFGAGLVAWERPVLGVGVGWSAGPERGADLGPSAYLRLGSLDGAHLRAELRTPTSTPGATGWARAGFAYNQSGRRHGLSTFLGVSAVEAGTDETYPTYPGPNMARMTRAAFFADASLPLGEQLDLFARGHVGPKTRGVGLGIALRFGR